MFLCRNQILCRIQISLKFVPKCPINNNPSSIGSDNGLALNRRQAIMWPNDGLVHYNDVIMGMMASQITSLMIVYSTIYSRRRLKKTSKLRITGLCAGNSPGTGEFPAQMVSNTENVSIWWRHHDTNTYMCHMTSVSSHIKSEQSGHHFAHIFKYTSSKNIFFILILYI